MLVLLTLVLPLQPVFASDSFFFFWELPPIPEPSPLVTTVTMADSTASPDITVDAYSRLVHCDPGPKNQTELLITYSDKFNNTVKVYCQWNPWIDAGDRQFIAFYNDKIIVGLCPFDLASNRHDIITKNGKISQTHWLSIRTNGSDYVSYNNFFG